MENRGVCRTCSSDKTCSFPRRFPVTFCEEFNSAPEKSQTKKEKAKGRK